MIMYRVLTTFRDLTDGYLYQAGDTFPHDGRAISQERIESLINGQNQAKMRFIEQVIQDITPEPEEAQKPVKRRRKKTE